MKKRQAAFFGILTLLLLLSGCSATSKLPTITWLEKVMQTIGVGPEAVAGDQSIALFMKFLIFLLVFAIVYFGVSKLFEGKTSGFGKGRTNKIAITISVVISLMGTLMIPNSFIIQLYQQYSMIFALFLAAAPLIAGIAIYFELVKKKPKAGEEGGLTKRTQHVIGAVIFIVLASVYGGLSSYLFKAGSLSGLPNHLVFYEWAMFATSWLQLCVVYFMFAVGYDIFSSIKGSKPSGGSDLADLSPDAPDDPAGHDASPTREMSPEAAAEATAKSSESHTLDPEEKKVAQEILDNAKKFADGAKATAKANKDYITSFESYLPNIFKDGHDLVNRLIVVKVGEEKTLKAGIHQLMKSIRDASVELKKKHDLISKVYLPLHAQISKLKPLIDAELELLGKKKRWLFGARNKFDTGFRDFIDLEELFKTNFLNPETSKLAKLIPYFDNESNLKLIARQLKTLYVFISDRNTLDADKTRDKLNTFASIITGQLDQIENVLKGKTGIKEGKKVTAQLLSVSNYVEKYLFELFK